MSALSQAIAAHRGAIAAVEAFDKSEVRDDGTLEHLLTDDLRALEDVARASCESEAEFLEKLSYLNACERAMSGAPAIQLEFGALAIAVAEHFDPRPAVAE
jgi:hypothetical protein